MTSRVRVSVIVPCFNGAAYLAQALTSAVQQTLRDIEVIVINDGSTDDSGRIADEHQGRHPDLIRVIHQENGGFCGARNAGLRAARGEYAAMLDCDDVWLPHHLEAAVAVLDARPEVGLVHADYEVIDSSSKVTGGPGTPRWQGVRIPAWEAIYLRQQHVACLTVVLRRRLLDEAGLFDAQFNRLGCEDRDLWLRIAALSEVVYLDDVHARYRTHVSNISKQIEKMTAGRLLLVEKHGKTERGRKLHARAMAAIYADRAYDLRQEGEFRQALGSYRKALAHHPWSLKTWKAAAAAAIGHR